MPIVHNTSPFGEGKNDQFEITQDGEPLDQETVQSQLPEAGVDLRIPVPEEGEKDYDIEQILNDKQSNQQKVDMSYFILLKVLGQGSFGKVFLVSKIKGGDSGALYAMKVLRKATLKVRDRMRTKMERDILACMNHPFIVKMHYAFQNEGKLYLILDLVKGGDLFTRLSREVMFTEEDAKFYLAELVLSLSHLHQCGILYRDLKPENILLEVDGHIKLTDFGLCKEAVYDEEKTYSFCGTIEYMAPEVVTRKGHGPAADWWSFGVLMYEMLTGTLPFHSANKRETMSLIINAKLGMPNFLSGSAQKLLRALFKRVPENRIGYKEGLAEFVDQPFFKSIDFEKLLRKEVSPPFIPVVPNDDSYTTRRFQCGYGVVDSPVTTTEPVGLFKGFSYVAPMDNDDACGTTNNPLLEKAKKKDQLDGFLPVRTTPIADDYDFFEIIGRGSFATVHRAVNKANRQQYAIKVMDKSKRNADEEIEILLRYSEHPNIATLRDVYDDGEKYYMVLEYLKGGELLDRINFNKGFSEKEVAYYIDKIARTLAYLHDHGVVHRDLQPSNIMFYDDSYRPDSIRITDFGFAKQIRADNGLLMTPCYTANFVAPEVLKRKGYDQASDIWSLGVIMYAMLSCSTPFATKEDDSENEILDKLIKSNVNLTTGIWTKVSDPAKSLLQSMLHMDPTKRITAQEVFEHPWIVSRESLPTVKLSIIEHHKIKSAMKAMFSALHKSNEVKPLASIESSNLMQRRAMKKGKK